VLACWGALLIFLWAREWAGSGAGLFALALFTASPVMLAHSFLAHSDITVTVFFVQTLYTFWRWSQRRTFLRFLVCGASLGLALISKLSGLILLPSLSLLLLARELPFWPFESDRAHESDSGLALGAFIRSGLRAGSLLVGLMVVAIAVVWVGYGFSFASAEVTAGALKGFWLPGYFHSLVFDVAANAQSRSIYFFGQTRSDGEFWYLIPIAWLLKTPIPREYVWRASS